MADDMTAAQRWYTMSRIRSVGNETTELRLVRLLREARLVGWRRRTSLPGKPDFVFRKARVAIFVDGCFWHGCRRCALSAKSNTKYWLPKIARNAARDKRITSELRGAGWVVIRILGACDPRQSAAVHPPSEARNREIGATASRGPNLTGCLLDACWPIQCLNSVGVSVGGSEPARVRSS